MVATPGLRISSADDGRFQDDNEEVGHSVTSGTRVGVINVTGYAGAELARILARHPHVTLVEVTGRSAAGEPLAKSFAHLAELGMTIRDRIEDSDVCFSALPHHASAELVPSLLGDGRKVIDISADFRLHDEATYTRWYGEHPSAAFLDEAVYGLPELHRRDVEQARLVANPGCYPTTSILALAPIAPLIEADVIVDAKSGVSGAGRGLGLGYHYSEINESVQPYGIDGHRHQPEIAQELDEVRSGAGVTTPVQLTFIPHLVPMTRGIMATCYARLIEPLTTDDLLERYRSFYAGQPFVRIVESPPATKHTWGSNYAFISPKVYAQTGRVVVTACIDNLVKGAAGQAVQNMNLMVGHAETAGLEQLPIYP
ncbi:MAG: N-acetyl-gamma-glutamyl-phosphate reductase [Chloroflexota bacterium]|nr:N-acetyl-gamma-glutamyl-phosphate reductase [Chloroflexota bacterium]